MTQASSADQVAWLQQPLRSAAMQTVAHALSIAGLTLIVDGVFERWLTGELIGVGLVVIAAVLRATDGFLEARAGRWMPPADYLADRARSWWGRLARYALRGAIWAACWCFIVSQLQGMTLDDYPAYLDWALPGIVGTIVVLRVMGFLFRGWCEGISRRAPTPAPSTWLVRPEPVVKWGRRAVGFGAIAVTLGALVFWARPRSRAAPTLEKVMAGAVIATFVCSGSARSAASKHGATRRVVQ